ncbi:MAG: transposase family protein [Thermodesulfobacteriaceae bacterium]|nr:transposase family protein [Thermodesulfobacteriaceae bacterium]
MVYFLDGIKKYILVAKDVASRFSLAYAYSHLSSRSGWREFKAVAPFEISGVQTDFGSEFLGEFAKELEREREWVL